MNRSLILSRLRIEVRRKQAGYPTEKTMVGWAKQFMDHMSLSHSSQFREWQRDLFLANLKNGSDVSEKEILQAKSSLLFLYERVLKLSSGYVENYEEEAGPGVFRITA